MRLEGRRVLISGAASGIGRATAELFNEEGAAVALIDNNAEALEETVASLQTNGNAAVTSGVADVTDQETLQSHIDRMAEELGGLDSLVGVAGCDLATPFDAMNREAWDKVISVNLTGAFGVTSAAIGHLKRAGGGSVLHISSGAGLKPIANRTAYCASKAGVVMFAKALAIDLAEAGIRSNVICPGAVDTPMFHAGLDEAPDRDAALSQVFDRYLIKKIIGPRDIAHAALFLTSDEAAHITGIAMAVDGGRTFH